MSSKFLSSVLLSLSYLMVESKILISMASSRKLLHVLMLTFFGIFEEMFV
jgi:hypothetical protein